MAEYYDIYTLTVPLYSLFACTYILDGAFIMDLTYLKKPET